MSPAPSRASVFAGRLFTLLAALSMLLAVDTRAQETDTIWPGESWVVSTPEAEGIDPAVIDSINAQMTAGEYGLIDAFLLIRHGRVVADYEYDQDYWSVVARYDTTDQMYNYDHPNWHPFLEGTKLHSLQSVTKSVNSAALGIAIDEGYIKGVEVPIAPYFDAYEYDGSDPRWSAQTLEDFLTMRAAIKWNTPGSYSDTTHSTIIMENSNAWIQYVLDQPMDAEPGARYQYNDGVSVLLGKIVREATGKRMDEWAREKLFEPIGIDDFYWKITPDGEADTEGGLYLTNDDLARIGYLFLRGGMWKGKRIVSEEWVRASTAPVVPDMNPANENVNIGYGYQWWVPVHEDGETKVFAANGYGGQFLFVAPEYDLVAVFNSWNIHERPKRSTWMTFLGRILPATER